MVWHRFPFMGNVWGVKREEFVALELNQEVLTKKEKKNEIHQLPGSDGRAIHAGQGQLPGQIFPTVDGV